MVQVIVNGEPALYNPTDREVFLEFSPAKQYPLVLDALLDNVVVPYETKVYVPVSWLTRRYPAAATTVRKTAAKIRRIYQESYP